MNAAGVFINRGLMETTPDEWNTTIAVNLTGTFLCVQCAVPFLRQAERATIVNIASGRGLLPTGGGSTAYVASKGGVIAMTRALAAELAPAIRVNAVCPGAVETPMTDGTLRDAAGAGRYRRSCTAMRWVGPPRPRRSPPPSCSSPRMKARSSPGSTWRWTAGGPPLRDGRQQITVLPYSGHERPPACMPHIQHKDRAMRIWSSLMIAAPVAAGLLAAPAAHADWRDQRGWHGDAAGMVAGTGAVPHDHDDGGAAAAAVLGLGAAAIVGGIIASQQQRYYAPPPPVVYAPPPYYAGYSQY